MKIINFILLGLISSTAAMADEVIPRAIPLELDTAAGEYRPVQGKKVLKAIPVTPEELAPAKAKVHKALHVATNPETNEPYNPSSTVLLKALKAEKSPYRSKEYSERLTKECPFRNANSVMEGITNEALNLQLAASVTNAQSSICETQLKTFNDTVTHTATLKAKLDSAAAVGATNDPEEAALLTSEIEKTQVAATAFNDLLKSGCQFRNGNKDVASIGNRLINILDTSAMVIAISNPANALIATTAAISGRLVISLSQWLFQQPDVGSALSKEASDSGRFINDLCLFRTLAYKYDDLYNSPFDSDVQELKNRFEIKNAAAARANELRQCATPGPTEALTKLTAFSTELSTAVQGPTSQAQCLNLMEKYNNTMAKDDATNNFKKLATSYGCPNPPAGSSPNIIGYCKSDLAIKELMAGGVLGCEEEDFRNKLAAKFTSLSYLLAQSIKENTKVTAASRSSDELQKLKEAEFDERIAIQRYAALQVVVMESPMSMLNSSKAMVAVGRTVLGKRFDDFASETLKPNTKNLNATAKIIADLPGKKKKADKTRDPRKAAIQRKEICTLVKQGQQYLFETHHSSLGVNDICTSMSAEGVPPLKSQALNFDNYSTDNKKKFGIFPGMKYISIRCKGLQEKTKTYMAHVRLQSRKLSVLNTENKCDVPFALFEH